jgi:hypothetical protein
METWPKDKVNEYRAFRKRKGCGGISCVDWCFNHFQKMPLKTRPLYDEAFKNYVKLLDNVEKFRMPMDLKPFLGKGKGWKTMEFFTDVSKPTEKRSFVKEFTGHVDREIDPEEHIRRMKARYGR